MKKKERQRIKKANKLLVSALMVGALFASPSFAADVTTWLEYQTAVNGSDATINVNDNITYEGTTNAISRTLSIIGTEISRYLSGNDAHKGFSVNTNGNLSLTNITMKNFVRGAGTVIDNSGTVDILTGKFELNKATADYGGVIYNNSGTVNNINAVFSKNVANTDGGAIYNYANGGSSIIGNIEGTFEDNEAGGNGGAIANYTDGETAQINKINATFENNSATNFGGAIYNDAEATISSIEQSVFTSNKAEHGGAIYNSGIIENIIGDFTLNTATANGGAINNNSAEAKITNITGDFSQNSANGAGGAIYNLTSGEISNIAGDFEYNSATTNGGAICNFGGSAKIGNIAGNFKGNHVDGSSNSNGGAIYNGGIIGNSDGTGGITGDFENNSATKWGGAIVNGKTINKVTGNFTKNSATSGGVVYNSGTINFVAENGKNITFSGNYVTDESGNGGAIFNANTSAATVGLYASANHSITFTGDTTGLPNTANNVDSIHNLNILNINGDGTITPYTGTVNLYNVTYGTTAKGTTNIYGGKVNVKGTFTQKDLNLKAGTFSLGKGGTVTNLNAEGGALSMSIADATYTNTIDTLNVDNYDGSLTNFTVDYDADAVAGSNMDKITINTGAEADSSITLTGVNVIKDGTTMADGTFIDGVLNDITDNTDSVTSTTTSGGWKYTFTSSSKGVVTVTRTVAPTTLAQVIQNATGSSSFSINTNPYTTNENLGSLAGDGRNLTIYGNGNTIDGTNPAGGKFNGITVGEAAGQVLNVENATMQNFTTAITNEVGSTTNINGVTFTNNTTDIANNGTLNFGGIANEVDSITGTGSTDILGGTVTVNDELTQNDLALNSGMLNMLGALSANNTVANGGGLNLSNDSYGVADLGNLTLNQNMPLFLDANLSTGMVDQISADSVSGTGKINMALNMPSRIDTVITNPNIPLNPIADGSSADLKGAIIHNSQTVTTPIFNYTTNYDKETGLMNFVGGGGYEGFNPSVMAGAVAAQVGGYLNQLTSYDNAFEHMDSYMLMTKDQRTAMKMLNRYASAGANLPTYNPNQLADESRGVWFKPYATFEKVNLKGGPNVENTAYGSFFGGDSDLIELGRGWDMIYSAYASYDGSHQNYDGVSVYQNGGHLGGTATFYKGNFFTGLTANVGASVAEASTMYGTDDMTMLMAGIASKTGYNWELLNSRLIVQPSMLMSYSFVNMFDYTNSAGVAIDSDPLHAIQIAPGLKFIGNLPNGWQPYISTQMIWNIMDDTKFQAVNVNLPQLSVKPYFQYGIGLQKKWGERFSGFGQVMLRNGGRTGVALSAGFRWALGKDVTNGNLKQTNNSVPELPKTKMNLSSANK